jgi:hypothetical protein
VQGRFVGATVGDRDADDDIVRGDLGVLRGDVEVPTLVEYTRFGQLELRIGFAALAVLAHEALVRELGVGVFVEGFQVGVRRRGVEVEVGLLHVFPVIAFGAGEAEQPLLENGIASVPKRQRETEPGLSVADA